MAVEDSQAEYRRALGREGQCGDRPPRRMQSVPKSAVAARRGVYSTPSGSPCGTIAGGPAGESAVDRIELPQAQCWLLKDTSWPQERPADIASR